MSDVATLLQRLAAATGPCDHSGYGYVGLAHHLKYECNGTVPLLPTLRKAGELAPSELDPDLCFRELLRLGWRIRYLRLNPSNDKWTLQAVTPAVKVKARFTVMASGASC